MKQSPFTVGDFVHLIRLCLCQTLADPEVTSHTRDCWHSPKTFVRRVFMDGGLLLENHAGFVRAAHPNDVSR
jgi:hypothetical protein